MRRYREKGKRSVLALLVTVALAFGLVPVGTFAFPDARAENSTESTSVEDAQADKGDAPEAEKNEKSREQNSDKTEIAGLTEQQGQESGEQNLGSETETQDQGQGEESAGSETEAQVQGELGEQNLMDLAVNTANVNDLQQSEAAPSQQESEDGGTDVGGTPLVVQGGVVHDGIASPTITVKPPVAGTTSATAPVVTVPGGAAYYVANTKWCDSAGQPLTGTVTFAADQTYYLSVQLKPNASYGTESYFRGTYVTCNGGTVGKTFNSTQTINGALRTVSLEPVVSVTATEAGTSRIRWGSNSVNGDVKYTYTNNGNQITGTQSGSSTFICSHGTTATLEAVPKSGYGFVGWFNANYDVSGGAFTPSGDAISTDPTLTISVTAASDETAYCAVFAKADPVEVALSGTASTFGTTTVNGTAVNTVSGEKTYVVAGQPVNIVIKPQSGYMVDNPKVPVNPPNDFAYQNNDDCSVTTITFTQPEGGASVLAGISKRLAITYDVNGGTKGSAWPENDLYNYVASGNLMRFSAPAELDASFATPPEGMEYAGYQIGLKTFAPGEDSGFSIVTSPVTIKLLWEPSKSVSCFLHTIANGRATMAYTDDAGQPKQTRVTGDSVAANLVAYGTDVTLTAEPDEGYSLKGWYVLDQNDLDDEEGTLVSTDTTYTYSATESTFVIVRFEHNHTWGAWTTTTEATCTRPGVEEHTCSGCDAKETREVAALGHDWGAWEVVKEATEAEDGQEKRICKRCGEVEERAIPHLVVEYRNTEGDGASWTKGSGEALMLVFKRNISDDTTFSHFTGIHVDDADVEESNYTAVAGSVVVTLKASYLEELAAGTHTITALFDDGNSASANFTVKAASEEAANGGKAGDDAKPASPKPAAGEPAGDSATGDGSKPANPAPSGGAKPASSAPAAGTTTRTGLPYTGDPTRALTGMLAAIALCGAAMLFAGSKMRPAHARGKHARR